MSEQSSLFRKVSLDRLSSPEQLDQKITVISPIGWVAIVSLAILLFAAVVWGFLGIVSDKVSGNGILMYGDGIVSITSQTSGQITDVYVQEGSYVEKGQIIARVTQDELTQQIEQVQKSIDALDTVNVESLDFDIYSLSNEVYSQFAPLLGQIRSARVQHEAQRLEAEKNEQDIINQKEQQAQQINALRRQIAMLEGQILQYNKQLEVDLEKAQKELEDAEILFDLGDISKNQLDSSRDEVSRLLREIELRSHDINNGDLGNFDKELNKPSFDSSLVSMQSQLEGYRLQLIQAQTNNTLLNDIFTDYLWGAYNQTGDQISSLIEQFADRKQVTLQDYQEHLEYLQTQYSKKTAIIAEFSGIVSGLTVQPYDLAQPGFVLGNIVRGDQVAVSSNVKMYVPMGKGKLVEDGMEVNISPTTVNREEHGYIIGQVVSVSASYVTQEHIMSILQNQQLVMAFGGNSAVIEVEVELLRDDNTISGYKWSTPKGAPLPISPGTICRGEIKVSDRRPIDMIVPFIKKLFQSSEDYQ
ncbi:MAG: NHLP bacteriocin system secretion protein [Firmicutes bacterium]|nr:NHLP bacteriocin system secretion protein [Bacillota bacterium]